MMAPTGSREEGSARARVLGDLVWIGGTAAALFILALHFGLIRRLSEHWVAGRASDLLARLGGDEFVVVCENVTRSADAEDVAARLSDSLSRRFRLKGNELTVSTSTGIALSETSPKRGETAETLLQDADAAMYRAKAQGPGSIAVFDRSMRADRVHRSQVEQQLREALDEGRFRLFYQPILTVADERIVGVEALLRLEDPDRGMVAPAEFVPELEDNGLIVPVGEWALETACAQVKRWHDDYPTIGALRVSVN